MEFSPYTIAIPYQGYIVLYNTLRQEALLINKEYVELFMNQNKEAYMPRWNSVEGKISMSLRENLCKKGYVINNPQEDIGQASKILFDARMDKNTLNIVIVPTTACNFRCWYCYEDHTDRSFMTKEETNKILKFIETRIHTEPIPQKISIHWFGGEPLLSYQTVMLPFMNDVYSLCGVYGIELDSGMTTNGYLIRKDMINSFDRWGTRNFQITIDGNESLHNSIRFLPNGKGSYKKIIRNIVLLANHNIHVTIRINVSDSTILDTGVLCQELKNEGLNASKYIHFHIEKVWQSSQKVQSKIESMTQSLSQNNFEVSSIYSSPHTIWKPCYADCENHITIGPHGLVYKCTARDFIFKNSEGHISDDGEINWNKYNQYRCRAISIHRKSCKKCSILPICNGGCSQNLMENNTETCPYNRTLRDKINLAKIYLVNHIL